MEFRIADTFTDSLARLTGDEQKAVKTTAFDLQLNPANPGMSFHKLDKAKDKNFWSVRVSRDIRLIVHKNATSLLLCYVDHHDKAYDWAERRKLETHPKTGAAQLVEIRETVQEILIPSYVEAKPPEPEASKKSKPLLFADVNDDQLLSYGVPAEWLKDVRQANEDTLLMLTDRLPGEAAEALLELATGGKPRVPTPVPLSASPFEHPDAQRRFRVMSNVEELERALEFPWDKWSIFLHPDQRQFVERAYTGPARIYGSAGTGKTIVAVHRAVFLARSNPDTRVLLTTFSHILANALHYVGASLHQSVEPPVECPSCDTRHALSAHGYYSRSVTSPKSGILRISVRRFRCYRCDRTISILPSFAQPYRLVLNATISEFFGGTISTRALSWLPLLKQYWNRFTIWLPQLDRVVGSVVSRSPPYSDPSGWWQVMAATFGDLGKITAALVGRSGVTVFGRYRCHSRFSNGPTTN